MKYFIIIRTTNRNLINQKYANRRVKSIQIKKKLKLELEKPMFNLKAFCQ